MTGDLSASETYMDRAYFDRVYASGMAPWVIGAPQPAIVTLERAGWIGGSVLDIGCGTGEHAIHLAELGYRVRGVDLSPAAIAQARATAASRQVPVEFTVADALSLDMVECFDTILDCALMHELSEVERRAYVGRLRDVCHPGAVLHVLALSDIGWRFGPRLSATAIREAFQSGWRLERLARSWYRSFTNITGEESLGEPVDLPAWLVRVRRVK